jgi:hypothetical protein
VKIIDKTRSSDSLLSSSSSSSSSPSTSPSSSTCTEEYRLNFESTTRFIDLKKNLFKITKVPIANQEWYWLMNPNFENLKSNIEDANNTATTTGGISGLSLFHKLLFDESIFNMPLKVVIDDNFNLIQIKSTLDEINSSSNSTVTTIDDKFDYYNLNSHSSSTSDSKKSSKLTPLHDVNVSSVIKLAFLVTVTGFNRQQQNNNKTVEFDQLSKNLNRKASITQEINKSKSDRSDYINDNEDDEEIMVDDDDDNDEEEDDLDVQFSINEASSYSKQIGLITDKCEVGNELAATVMFNEEFTKRYGPMVPLFFIGSLEEAVRECLHCPAKDRRLLGIYMHTDRTIFSNIFAAKTMCNENVINFLVANFIIWPWDVTSNVFCYLYLLLLLKRNLISYLDSIHEKYYHETCSRHLGNVASSAMHPNKQKLPALLVITRIRGINEVISVIEGDATSDHMMQRLMQAWEMFDVQRAIDEKEEKSRDEREMIKREQDEAYRASLDVDKAKSMKI